MLATNVLTIHPFEVQLFRGSNPFGRLLGKQAAAVADEKTRAYLNFLGRLGQAALSKR
jgi:hypothetical protein